MIVKNVIVTKTLISYRNKNKSYEKLKQNYSRVWNVLRNFPFFLDLRSSGIFNIYLLIFEKFSNSVKSKKIEKFSVKSKKIGIHTIQLHLPIRVVNGPRFWA